MHAGGMQICMMGPTKYQNAKYQAHTSLCFSDAVLFGLLLLACCLRAAAWIWSLFGLPLHWLQGGFDTQKQTLSPCSKPIQNLENPGENCGACVLVSTSLVGTPLAHLAPGALVPCLYIPKRSPLPGHLRVMVRAFIFIFTFYFYFLTPRPSLQGCNDKKSESWLQ